MRRLVIAALLAPALAAAKPKAEPARVAPPPSEPRHATDKPKPIDIKPIVDKLDVLKDDVGDYYVVPRQDAMTLDDAGAWIFFGDSKTLYQQRVIGSSSNPNVEYEWYLWAPRAKNLAAAKLDALAGRQTLECNHGADGKRKLVQLNADEAKTFLGKATFLPPLWQRQSHVLLRDDDGVYYFVDMLRDEFGGNGYRVFVGPKGAMKELAMTNVATDSAGEIFATKSGQLKLVTKDGKAFWIKGGKKTELTELEPAQNKYLIYRELGIYGSLGTVCDDL